MSHGAGPVSRNYRLVICAIVMAACPAFPDVSWGYLDPGAGSFAFQFLIAAGMAALFAIKMFWARIKAFFRRGTDSTAEPIHNATPGKTPDASEQKPAGPAHLAGPDKEES